MMWRFVLTLLVVLEYISAGPSQGTDPVVLTEHGPVRGRLEKTVGKNKPYYAFRGIPYAEPPLGTLRFEPPQPPRKWTNIRNAIEDASGCTQGYIPVEGSEDCLYLNVYTPRIGQVNLSVIFYIYGGGHIFGNSSYEYYGPDYLLEHDVVFVSLNYRLGIFGFLSTEDLVAPGNNGLKDCVLALKWVQKNIRNFGGNPNSVTIVGESSGASMVTFLLESRMSPELVHGAIMQSGSSLCAWSLFREPLRTAQKVGKQLKIDYTNSSQFVERLRNISAADLQLAVMQVWIPDYTEEPTHDILFAPVSEVDHSGAIYVGRSYEKLTSGNYIQVPTIIGWNSMEVTGNGTGEDFTKFVDTLTRYEQNRSLYVPDDMNVLPSKKTEVGNLIHDHYFGSSPIASQPLKIYKYYSDRIFYRPERKTAELQAKFAPLYLYQLSYQGTLFTGKPGVAHAEDLTYLFRSEVLPSNLTDANDILTRRRMVTLWTNFAKSRCPTPVKDQLFQNVIWPKMDNKFSYLDINSNFEVKTYPFETDLQFWENIYKQYVNRPYATY